MGGLIEVEEEQRQNDRGKDIYVLGTHILLMVGRDFGHDHHWILRLAYIGQGVDGKVDAMKRHRQYFRFVETARYA